MRLSTMRGSDMRLSLTSGSAVAVSVVLFLSGCGHDPRNEVPGHLEPGSVSSVVNQMHGGKGDQIERIGRQPLARTAPANRAVLNDAEVAYGWFPDRVSDDGEALRWGHWVAIKVRESSFVQEDLNADAIFLEDLGDVFIDDQGQVRGRVLGAQEPLSGPSAQRRNAHQRPWQPGSGRAPVRVTVVEDAGTGASPRGVGESLVNPAARSGASGSDVNALIQQVQQNLQTQRLAPPTPPSTQAQPVAPAPNR